ncbi:superfamily II DNA/RNA helicase [Bradyrhizobium sp. AZCC 1693]
MAFSPSTFATDRAPGAGVTAVLGPTNTGKTHLAIERMLGHSSGVIGLPLRLLAREVYNKIADRAGVDSVALVTGEEKIKPKNPRYWVSTVEAMPRDLDVSFLAVDEIQIAADLERGHVFTDRILHRRGRDETLLLGAATMRPIIERLLPGASIITRPRLSQLEFAGDRKITRQPRRTAIVAFSADEVYAIAELIPAAAWRRCRCAGLALAAHAQCAGGDVPERRRRLSRRHRRRGHGAEPRCRSRRLCLRPQI